MHLPTEETSLSSTWCNMNFGCFFPWCSNFDAHVHSHNHWCLSVIAWCKTYFTVETLSPWIFSEIFIYSCGYKSFRILKQSFSSQLAYPLTLMRFYFSTICSRCFAFFVFIVYTIAMNVLAIKNCSLYIVFPLITLNPTEIVI